MSGIPQLSGEVLLVDDEHVDAAARQLREELRPAHTGCLSGARHRDRALLIPMSRSGEAHLIGHLVGALRRAASKLSGTVTSTWVINGS